MQQAQFKVSFLSKDSSLYIQVGHFFTPWKMRMHMTLDHMDSSHFVLIWERHSCELLVIGRKPDCKYAFNKEVRFNNLSGLERRPISHTCSCVLELPSSYEMFEYFAHEFQAVLSEESSWKIDAY